MNKYFYTCPIKALYMMKEFGVKFYIKVKQISSYNLTTGEMEKNNKTIEIDFEEEYLDQVLGSFVDISELKEKIYVAKESEHIFEPKERDIVSDGELFGDLCSKSPYEARSAFSINDEGGTRVCKNNELKIIMRDNKQFFMPEVEND